MVKKGLKGWLEDMLTPAITLADPAVMLTNTGTLKWAPCPCVNLRQIHQEWGWQDWSCWGRLSQLLSYIGFSLLCSMGSEGRDLLCAAALYPSNYCSCTVHSGHTKVHTQWIKTWKKIWSHLPVTKNAQVLLANFFIKTGSFANWNKGRGHATKHFVFRV